MLRRWRGAMRIEIGVSRPVGLSLPKTPSSANVRLRAQLVSSSATSTGSDTAKAVTSCSCTLDRELEWAWMREGAPLTSPFAGGLHGQRSLDHGRQSGLPTDRRCRAARPEVEPLLRNRSRSRSRQHRLGDGLGAQHPERIAKGSRPSRVPVRALPRHPQRRHRRLPGSGRQSSV
jgi:hypothetical protein